MVNSYLKASTFPLTIFYMSPNFTTSRGTWSEVDQSSYDVFEVNGLRIKKEEWLKWFLVRLRANLGHKRLSFEFFVIPTALLWLASNVSSRLIMNRTIMREVS